MSISFSNSIGSFIPGDMGWAENRGLFWPCIIKEKKHLSSRREVLPTDQFEVRMRNRIIAFAQDRFEYQIVFLPEKEGALITRFDFQICPFNYTTEPRPVEDADYNRALINAIQIQSSYAIPEEPKPLPKLESQIQPPLNIPIHIGCPMVSGKYLYAKIVQHIVDPTLVLKMTNGEQILDLSEDLHSQGISHWKNPSAKLNLFNRKSKLPELALKPFPTLKNVDHCRIGSQIISKGDLVEMKNKQLFLVDYIKLAGEKCYFVGVWYEKQVRQDVPLIMFKQRFDPCFECDLMFQVIERCYWDGQAILDTDRRVKMDDF